MAVLGQKFFSALVTGVTNLPVVLSEELSPASLPCIDKHTRRFCEQERRDSAAGIKYRAAGATYYIPTIQIGLLRLVQVNNTERKSRAFLQSLLRKVSPPELQILDFATHSLPHKRLHSGTVIWERDLPCTIIRKCTS